MIDSLVGLRRTSATGSEAYIHADLIDKFVGWLNDNNLEMAENSNGKRWETMILDDVALLDFKESDNFCAFFIGRIKVGYARGSEEQTFYQSLLNQVFSSRFLRTWRV